MSSKRRCYICGSERVKRKVRIGIEQRYVCKSCGRKGEQIDMREVFGTWTRTP